jgi:chemotaxis protein MotB
MARQTNAAPVIIKRKKIVAGGGHHGGAWKVAYADFVTAMMAFFLLMWLLGATTEKQRKGVADYFSPAIPISPQSGGGSGAFRGDNALAAEDLAHSGKEQASQDAQQQQSEAIRAEVKAQQKTVDDALSALAGESMTMEQALRHVVTKVTDEGLVIEIFDLPEAPLFLGDTDQPQPVTTAIAPILAEVLEVATNRLAVNGHVRSYPITMIENPAWDLSAARAARLRDLIQAKGLAGDRFQRFSGFADRKPVTADATALRNNRIDIVLLRWDR